MLLTKVLKAEPNVVVAKLIDDIKNIGLEYGTMWGHSISLSDIKVPTNRNSMIEGKATLRKWRRTLKKV